MGEPSVDQPIWAGHLVDLNLMVVEPLVDLDPMVEEPLVDLDPMVEEVSVDQDPMVEEVSVDLNLMVEEVSVDLDPMAEEVLVDHSVALYPSLAITVRASEDPSDLFRGSTASARNSARTT